MDGNSLYYEIVCIAFIIMFVMQYVGAFSINKFVEDNASYFQKLKETDYELLSEEEIDNLFKEDIESANININ